MSLRFDCTAHNSFTNYLAGGRDPWQLSRSFIGIGVQVLTLAVLRKAKTIEQARPLLGLITMSEPLSIVSALLLLASGIYMALTFWSLQAGWIAVSLGSLVVFAPLLIRGIVEPRLRVITTMAEEAQEGPIPTRQPDRAAPAIGSIRCSRRRGCSFRAAT